MKGEQIKIIAGLERRYTDDGLKPVRWRFEKKAGCRSCGDELVGPWTVSIMSSLIPERGEALIFVVTLCGECLGDEDKRDDVAEAAVQGYLTEKR